MPNVHDFTAQNLEGSEVDLSTYKGQVLLIVNTASKCGIHAAVSGLGGAISAMACQGFSVCWDSPAISLVTKNPAMQEKFATSVA